MDITFRSLIGKGLFGILAEYSGAFWLLGFALCAVVGYLLGSINFALVISKYKYKEDIRGYGSGNAGTTNMMRTYGKGAAIFTLLGDGSKAALSVLIGTLLNGEMGAYVAGLFCIVGHVYPLYFKFKGGKGIVTTAVLILCLNPLVFLLLLLLFVAIVAATRYISLGSIMCMLVYPLLLFRLSPEPDFVKIISSVLLAIFVIFLHRANIKRLWNGKENKFSFKKSEKKAKQ